VRLVRLVRLATDLADLTDAPDAAAGVGARRVGLPGEGRGASGPTASARS